MLAPLLTPKAPQDKDSLSAWAKAVTQCVHPQEDSSNKMGREEAEEGSCWKRTGEYGLMVLLALGMCYVLLLANGNARFGDVKISQPPWPQPRHEVPGWLALHLSYVDKIAQSVTGEGFDVLMYGDTLVEAWRGTFLGEPSSRAHGSADVFHSHFSHRWNAAALGIAGDATSNLMWRLQNGETVEKLKARVVLLYIGSSDLTYASFQGDDHINMMANATAIRTVRIADYLGQAVPGATVIILGLLPRGDITVLPNPSGFALPSKFSGAITKINKYLEAFTETHTRAHHKFLDCSPYFVTEDDSRIDNALMPDSVLPNAAGMEQLAQCLVPAIEEVLEHGR